MKLTKNINTGDEELVFRTISTSPKEHFEGRWKSGRLYPLYSVVVNNGTTFVSQNAKMKEEPYVIYDAVKQEFKANDGWKIKEMSADSRLTALGGGSAGGGVTPEDVAEMISGKQDTIEDLSAIRSGASAGATAYQKPNSGIPASDIASGVIPTDVVKYSLQTLTDAQKAEARANIEAQDFLVSGTNIKTVNGESILGSGNIVASDPNAVKYTEQTLTDAQKTQSRTNIGAGTYSKPSGGIPASDIASGVIPTVPTISTDISADAASDAKTASPKAVKTYVDNGIAAVESDLSDLADEVESIDIGAYEVAWDGNSEPVVANIPAGVSVTYNTTTYTGTLAASASTKQKIYLVATGTTDNYDRYVTVGDSTYSWENIGTTEITLADYATKTEVNQLEAKVGYLTCSTAGATAAKKITRSNFVLSQNLVFVLKFASTNTANDVTLNINNTGDIPFYYNGARASASNAFSTDNLLVWYNGTEYRSITLPDFTQQPFGQGKRAFVSQDALRALWANTAYVMCSTAGETAAKEVTMYGYVLRTYTLMMIRFRYANTADNVTLNINGTGAKPFNIRDARCTSTNTYGDNTFCLVYYDGNNFVGMQMPFITDEEGNSERFVISQKGVTAMITPLRETTDEVRKYVGRDGNWIEQGGIDTGTGLDVSSTTRVRTKYKISYPTHIVTNSGFRIFRVTMYNKDGTYGTEEFYGFTDQFTRDIYITRDTIAKYDVRVTFARDDRDAELTPIDNIISVFPAPTQEYMNVSAQPIKMPRLDDAKNKTLGVIQRTDTYNRRKGLVWSDDYCWRWANDNTLVTDSKSYKCIRISDGGEVCGNDTEHIYSIASMTKLLAAVVICRYVTDWNETIVIANTIETDEHFVQNGDIVTYANILAAMMVASDNNAANAVMRPIGRKIDPTAVTDDAAKQAFCDAMAVAASDIGMTNTSNFISAVAYVNSTTSDLCKLLKYVYDTAQCAKIKDYWGLLTYTMSVQRNGQAVTYDITSSTPAQAADLIPEYVGGKTGSMTVPYTFLTWGFVWQSIKDNNYYALAILDASYQNGRIYDARHIIDEAYGLLQ